MAVAARGASGPDGSVAERVRPAQAEIETLLFPTTLMPAYAIARFYAPLLRGLPPGRVRFHALPRGGLGRTDAVVDGFRPGLEAIGARGGRVRLVGHSLGGVVAWALAHDYPDIVAEVELYAAPLRGTSRLATWMPLPEARFLTRASRWLGQYDRPLNGPMVRSVYTFCDVVVTPAREVCRVEGDRAENHYVVPFHVPARQRRDHEHLHRAAVSHTALPRHARLQARLRRMG